MTGGIALAGHFFDLSQQDSRNVGRSPIRSLSLLQSDTVATENCSNRPFLLQFSQGAS